jgi:hypothetical protein
MVARKYIEKFWPRAMKMCKRSLTALYNCTHKVGLMINGRKTEFKEREENRNTLEIVEEFAWFGTLSNAINIRTEL